MLNDEERRLVFDALEASVGARPAALLMTSLPPFEWTELATRADITALRAELRGEIAALRGELKGEMSSLRSELTGELAALRGELKADSWKMVAAAFGSSLTFGGVVLAAVTIAS